MNELSNRLELQVLNGQNQDQASDFVGVRSKKKKSKGSKSPQGQQAATGMDQEHQEHVARQRNDTAVIIGDSIIKGLRHDLFFLFYFIYMPHTIKYIINKNANVVLLIEAFPVPHRAT